MTPAAGDVLWVGKDPVGVRSSGALGVILEDGRMVAKTKVHWDPVGQTFWTLPKYARGEFPRKRGDR